MPASLRLDVGAAVVGGVLVEPASVLVTADGTIAAAGRPAEIGEHSAATVEAHHDLVAVPGFVDLQVNGAAGHDFRTADADGLRSAMAYLVSTGTTSCCPTIVSAPVDRYRPALGALGALGAATPAPRVLGAHLEGPFLNPRRRGAHDVDVLLPPDARWAGELVDTSPVPVAIWTLAPELGGAGAVIDALSGRGVVVSAGHTDATFAELRDARDRGVSMVTHLFNAQRPLHHREPGVVGGALALDGLWVGLILDFVHVERTVAELAARLLGGRAFAVTDAVAPVGLPPGRFGASGREVDTGTGVPLLADGVIAGSMLTMDQAFRNALTFTDWPGAARLTSTAPAEALRRDDIGAVAPGRAADLALLDRAGNVRGVVAGGRWAVAP